MYSPDAANPSHPRARATPRYPGVTPGETHTCFLVSLSPLLQAYIQCFIVTLVCCFLLWNRRTVYPVVATVVIRVCVWISCTCVLVNSNSIIKVDLSAKDGTIFTDGKITLGVAKIFIQW